MVQLFSRGVEDLITRLQEEGVQQGELRADKLISDAHHQAATILSRALKEAEATIENAKFNAATETQAAQEALRLALRDMLIDFRAVVSKEFKEEIGRIIQDNLYNPEFVKDLLLLIANKSLDALGDYKLHELKLKVDDNEYLFNSNIDNLVHSIASALIQQGVDFKGLKVFSEKNQMLVDFSSGALQEALAEYLQPKFIYLLQGLKI